MTTTTIERAAEAAEQLSATSIAARQKRIDALVQRGTAVVDGLLGIEAGAEERLKEQLRTLQRERQALVGVEALAKRYRRLSLDPLTWRDKAGMPQLVVFDLKTPRFELACTGSHRYYGYGGSRLQYSTRITPKLPRSVAACYADVLGLLKAEARAQRKTIRLTCQFGGLIPIEVKEAIAEARDVFGRDLYLIAEPVGFDRKVTAIKQARIDPDPIVVGYRDGAFWVIATFDLTPLEEAVRQLSLGKLHEA
jgi:hypothetical protein